MHVAYFCLFSVCKVMENLKEKQTIRKTDLRVSGVAITARMHTKVATWKLDKAEVPVLRRSNSQMHGVAWDN